MTEAASVVAALAALGAVFFAWRTVVEARAAHADDERSRQLSRIGRLGIALSDLAAQLDAGSFVQARNTQAGGDPLGHGRGRWRGCARGGRDPDLRGHRLRPLAAGDHPAAQAAGNVVNTPATAAEGGVYADLENVMGEVEDDGFDVSGLRLTPRSSGSCASPARRPATRSVTRAAFDTSHAH